MRTICEKSSIFRSRLSDWFIGELAKSRGEGLALVMAGQEIIRRRYRPEWRCRSSGFLAGGMVGGRGGNVAETWPGGKEFPSVRGFFEFPETTE
jgi:hypothetical protein